MGIIKRRVVSPPPVTMRVLCVLLALGASGELLAALKRLQSQDFFKTLSKKDEIILTDLVAAAETCKLTDFEQGIGRAPILAALSHLAPQVEGNLETYLKNHLAQEKNGTCTVA